MLSIKTFCFNPFQVNQYLIYDELGHAVIIDAACYEEHEKKELKQFIDQHKLTIEAIWLSHSHIDHIVGTAWMKKTFNAPLIMHQDGEFFMQAAPEYARMFGFNILEFAKVSSYFSDETLFIGNDAIHILNTPGHANGSVCFYAPSALFVVTGDVLFHNSIGRTDLPTGDYNTLINNIETKLLTLPDKTIVYPGHGGHTTIGNEKINNPFLNKL